MSFHQNRFSPAKAAWFVIAILSTAGLLQAGISPVYDDFIDRIVLAGQTDEHTGSNTDATLEAGERAETGFKTVWYEWTAPDTGFLSVTGAPDGFSGRVSVYTGTILTDLKLAARVGSGVFAQITKFPVAAGTVYFIAFGGHTATDDGNYTLTVALDTTTARSAAFNALNATSATGANDDFADRVTLTGENVTGIGYRFDATREAEAVSHGQRTAWWSWTAPSDGLTKFSNEFSEGSERLNIYSGDTLGALTLVRSRIFSGNDTEVEILTDGGVTYQIVVGDSQLNSERYHNVLTITHASPIPRAKFRGFFSTGSLNKKRAMGAQVLNPVVADSLICKARGNGRCSNLVYNQGTGYFTFRHRSKSRYRPAFVVYKIIAMLDGRPNGFVRERFPVRVKKKR